MTWWLHWLLPGPTVSVRAACWGCEAKRRQVVRFQLAGPQQELQSARASYVCRVMSCLSGLITAPLSILHCCCSNSPTSTVYRPSAVYLATGWRAGGSTLLPYLPLTQATVRAAIGHHVRYHDTEGSTCLFNSSMSPKTQRVPTAPPSGPVGP